MIDAQTFKEVSIQLVSLASRELAGEALAQLAEFYSFHSIGFPSE